MTCICGRRGFPPDPKLSIKHPELCLYEEDGTGVWRCRSCVVRLMDEALVMAPVKCARGRHIGDPEGCFPCEIMRAGTQPA